MPALEAGVEQALDAEAEQAVEEAGVERAGVEEAGAVEAGAVEAGAEAGAEAGVVVNNMRFATTRNSFLGLISATVVSFVLQNRKSQLHEIVNNTPEGQRLLQEKKRDLKRKLVVCLVKIVGLLPWRKRLMKTWSSWKLQVWVVRKILKLPYYFNFT